MRIKNMLVSAALIGLTICPRLLLSQAAIELPRVPKYSPSFTSVDVKMVMDALASAIKKTIVVDPVIRTRVSVHSTRPLTAEEFRKEVVRVLTENGLSVHDDDGVLRVSQISSSKDELPAREK